MAVLLFGESFESILTTLLVSLTGPLLQIVTCIGVKSIDFVSDAVTKRIKLRK